MFLNCSTCFKRHIAHHQEIKICTCSLCFYIRFWLPVGAMPEWELSSQPSQRPATKNVCKTRGCNYSLWAPYDERCVARNILRLYVYCLCCFETTLRPDYSKSISLTRGTNSHESYYTQLYPVLTLRRLMSYIYGAPILDVSRSHTKTHHSR